MTAQPLWLDVSRPDGSIMSDEAVKAYRSGSNLGTSWQPYWQTASTSPTTTTGQRPVSHNLSDSDVATLTHGSR